MGRFIEIQADMGPLESELDKFSLRIQGEQLTPRVAKGALAEVQESYQAERDPDGISWPERTPKYQAYKDRVRPGKQKGFFDDVLFGSLGFRVEGTSAEIGSIGGPPYAAAQNFGTQSMPRSEFAGASDAFWENAEADSVVYVSSGEFGGVLA